MAPPPAMKPASRKRGPPAPDPVELPPPGFVADRAEAAARVERLLRYQFRDGRLLEEALTHQSFADDAVSYQRLEFVGDSALGLAFSNFLYLTNPTLGPGPLSTLRAANISTEKLARVAVRHDLYPLLRRNCPRLDLLVGQFIETVKQEPEDDLSTVPYGGSVVKAPKVLADIVEAIAAAVYVDCKFDLEKLWKKHGKMAQFKTWQKGGMTVVNVFVAGELVGIGSSEQKVIAKLNAARDATRKLAGAKKQVLTTGVGNGLGDEIGELRECKQKLNEQCSRQNWPKPIFKQQASQNPALSSLHSSSFFPFPILSKAEQCTGRKLGDWVIETKSWQLELERWGGAAAVSSVAGEQWGCKLDQRGAAMARA
ncbi:ribonuclease 3-like protein 2 isoform X3 [Oryza sativa Japonica Group]|uniref:ribonuclease 3-like protein 2 isoform X3 n=1 Tax=Oryza sativa subsp. japonica TaxID=39947 RepID=UPI0007754EE3|nr:ribonuclease 3-like protein 2 isoform X4 [Oryza sativa Japonica Group]